MPNVNIYDPNGETTNDEQIAAAHWECLRRNTKFREAAANWTKSENFRFDHAESPNYDHSQIHYQRCALDWMLTSPQRVALAKKQIASGYWFKDLRFNFGPMSVKQILPSEKIVPKKFHEAYEVRVLHKANTLLSVNDSWREAPEAFRKQFRFACLCEGKLEVITEQILLISEALRRIAKYIAAGDPHHQADEFARDLTIIGEQLHEYGEFTKVFALSKVRYSNRKFKEQLNLIRHEFQTLVDPDSKYNRYSSYFGTKEDWKWFLEAERLGLDVKNLSDCYELAKVYSEAIRHTSPSKRPRNAKTGGFRGSKISSSLLRNRRRTVKRHVENIHGWINKMYPPQNLS